MRFDLSFLMKQEQPDGNISAELHFMGKTYELSGFCTSFAQPIDEKGEPLTEVKGGILNLTLSQAPDNLLSQWAVSQWSRKSGEVVFKNETGTPPLRIKFVEAACVGLSQENVAGKGIETKLVVSSKSVSFNAVILEKEWRE